jgi:DNA-directed RNA polymerase specialized sigma24 family protein
MTAVDDLSLQLAEAAFQESSDQTERLRKARNALVTQARAEGWTHERIARAMGLSRGRIGQLAQRLNQNGTSS